MGPQALRVAGLQTALERLGMEVLDAGDVTGPANPCQAAVNGHRHLKEVVAWNKAVHTAVSSALHAGNLPVVLGGDHCIAVGSIAAVAQYCVSTGKNLRVLWLDAHADFNTAAITPSGNVHGMPLAILCGHGPRELTQLGGRIPTLKAEAVRLIGVRSVDESEKSFVHSEGLEVFDMRFIDEHGMRHALQQALMDVDESTHIHLSLDTDFLEPDIAPGVGTAVRGGPTYREAQLCMEMIADTGALGSVDIVELNPACDVRNQTAVLLVDLMESLFGKSTLMRPA
jgi:arginase